MPNKKKIKFSITILFLCSFLFLQCSDEGTGPEKEETFELEFLLINNGDSEVESMTLVARIYWPKENEAWEVGRLKEFIQPYDTLRYLPAQDTLYPMPLGYAGCVTLIGARIYKRQWYGDSSKTWHYWYLDPDTIKSKSDRISIFNWPTDTSRATMFW